MKERVRWSDGLEIEHRKCSICGLRESTIKQLENIDPDIPIPYLTAGFADHLTICSECKEAIMDHIFDNYIQIPTNQGLFGINLRKIVNKFIKENKTTFKDIAADYEAIAEVYHLAISHIKEFQKKNEETLNLPCPTMKELKEFISDYNSGKIMTRTDNLKAEISIEPSIVPNALLFDIFNNQLIVDRIKKIGTLYKVSVKIDIQLMFEEDCSVNFVVFAIDQDNKEKEPESDNNFDIQTGGFTIE